MLVLCFNMNNIDVKILFLECSIRVFTIWEYRYVCSISMHSEYSIRVYWTVYAVAGSVQCACAAGLWWFVFEWLGEMDFDGFWIFDFDFLDFRCETLNKFNLTGSVLHIFQTTTKWRAQLKLLQNEAHVPQLKPCSPKLGSHLSVLRSKPDHRNP